jgi:hypothetical protein
MPPTPRGSVIANKIVEHLELNASSLGLKAVFYGDQARIPTSPVACVEPAITDRELRTTQVGTTNTFQIAILLYHTSIEGTQTIQEVLDVISEDVAKSLNRESMAPQVGGGTQFGGTIIHGHVRRLEFGYRLLADKLMRCNRLIWTGTTMTPLLEA